MSKYMKVKYIGGTFFLSSGNIVGNDVGGAGCDHSVFEVTSDLGRDRKFSIKH